MSAPSAKAASSGAGGRIAGLDTVRSWMMLSVLTAHAGAAFVIGTPDWPISYQPSVLPSIVIYVVTHYSISAFLFIGGFLGRAQCERRGLSAFVKDRAFRIVLPLIVIWPINRWLMDLLFQWGDATLNASGSAAPPHPWNAALLFWGHMWFLVLLAELIAFVALMRLLPLERAAGWASRHLIRAINGGYAPIVLALPFTMATALFAGWNPWVGIPTPIAGWIPNPWALSAYATAFFVGWLAQREPQVISRLETLAPAYLVLAPLFSIAALATIILLPATPPVPAGPRFVQGLVYALGTWFWTLGLIGGGARWGGNPGRFMQRLNAASYWIYLFHLPLVCAMQIIAYRIPGAADAKFLAILALALPLLLLSHAMLAHGWLGDWLGSATLRSRSGSESARHA